MSEMTVSYGDIVFLCLLVYTAALGAMTTALTIEFKERLSLNRESRKKETSQLLRDLACRTLIGTIGGMSGVLLTLSGLYVTYLCLR